MINNGIRQRISVHIVAFLFLTMVEIFYCGNMSVVLVIRYREIMNNTTEIESEIQKQSCAKKKNEFTNLINVFRSHY